MSVPVSLSPEQRALRASIAANTRWSQEDPKPALAKVREGYRGKWLDQVDPDRVLPEAERNRRADAAMRAHMQRMALKSAKARAQRASRSDRGTREPDSVANEAVGASLSRSPKRPSRAGQPTGAEK